MEIGVGATSDKNSSDVKQDGLSEIYETARHTECAALNECTSEASRQHGVGKLVELLLEDAIESH